jgi:hypothetical protein
MTTKQMTTKNKNIIHHYTGNTVYWSSLEATWSFVKTTINTYITVIDICRVEDSVRHNANSYSFAATAVSESVRAFTAEKVHEYSK